MLQFAPGLSLMTTAVIDVTADFSYVHQLNLSAEFIIFARPSTNKLQQFIKTFPWNTGAHNCENLQPCIGLDSFIKSRFLSIIYICADPRRSSQIHIYEAPRLNWELNKLTASEGGSHRPPANPWADASIYEQLCHCVVIKAIILMDAVNILFTMKRVCEMCVCDECSGGFWNLEASNRM